MIDQPQAVVLDTDVFSLVFVVRESQDARVAAWRDLVAGRRVLISFQTRAELLAGALQRGWGETRTAKLRALLDETPTIPASTEVVDAYAVLTATCKRQGHALQDRVHTGDRWVAACAIAHGLPLVGGGDAIFENTPGLSVLV